MAFPVREGTATSTDSATTSHTVSLPSSIVSGETLVVWFALDDSGADTISWPAGWTELDETDVNLTNSAVGYRIANGSEGSTITVTTSVSDKSAHIAYRISGTSGNTPAISVEGGGPSNTPNPPSLTPSWGAADTLWLASMETSQARHTSSPSNYTDTITVIWGFGGNAVAERERNIATEDPGDFSSDWSGDLWVAHTVAIEPASGGSTTNQAVAIAHTIVASLTTATIRVLTSSIAHVAAASTVLSTIRIFTSPITHTAAITSAKKISVFKAVAHAIAASTTVTAIRNFTSTITHNIAVSIVRANLFTLASAVTHTITTSTATVFTHIFTGAITHATAVALVKKIKLIRAVAHAVGVSTTKLIQLVAKAVTHSIGVTLVAALLSLVGSSITHTVTATLGKTIKMAKAIGHSIAAASTKVVKVSKSIAHTVSVSAAQVATLFSASSITHTIGAVTGSVLRAAHNVAVGLSHVVSLATQFIAGGGVVIDKLHRRLRAWRRMH